VRRGRRGVVEDWAGSDEGVWEERVRGGREAM
jgi:hypothetical protein